MASIESTESSSPIVTRAVAAGLLDRYCDNYQFPGWQKLLLQGLGIFPPNIARFTISRFQTISGLPPSVLENLSIQTLVQERLNDYAHLAGKFPAITIGAALGGATTYLSLAVGGPFLPQAFVATIKHGSSSSDATEYLHRSLEAALRIAEDNPNVLTIQHFDPVHDGWLTRFVNHLRLKLLDLPAGYRDFIKAHLEPGGAILFLEGGASWLRYRLGPRSVFQVGGWGGIPAEEFLDGSKRLQEYARQTGLKYAAWKLEGYSLERGPESEWGSEPGFGVALAAFCAREGYHFIRLPLPHPNDFSRLAFSTARRLLEKQGQTPGGVSVEMFSQFDATAARRGGLLPLWLVFNTEDSLDFLQKMKPDFPAEKPVFFSPLSTFSITPDIVPFQGWSSALGQSDWINSGARESHYPADARALVKWGKPLRAWVEAHPQPIQGVLSAEELAGLAKSLA